MDEKKFGFKLAFPIGLMLFSFFFGAGNLIFPPVLGQLAGTNLVAATIGFCLSAVGLPVLGVLVIAKNKFGSPNELGLPAGKYFALVVTVLSALSLGPFFAIPRTCATSFSVITGGGSSLTVSLIYSAIYFGLTFWMVMKPGRILHVCGKLMAPLLLIFLAILMVAVFCAPMGGLAIPAGDYATMPMIKGMFEGYNTMDVFCSLLLASTIIGIIKTQGIEKQEQIIKTATFAGVIAGGALTVIYAALCYCGGQSVSVLGLVDDGGALVSKITGYYFANMGSCIVSAIFFLACITTSVGLVTGIADYFSSISCGKISYRNWVICITVFSAIVANFGLTNIVKYSIPILVMLYPIIFVMFLLNTFPAIFKRNPYIFRGVLWPTALVAINDGLCYGGITCLKVMFDWLPFYNLGLAWVTPAIAGLVIGIMIQWVLGKKL